MSVAKEDEMWNVKSDNVINVYLYVLTKEQVTISNCSACCTCSMETSRKKNNIDLLIIN